MNTYDYDFDDRSPTSPQSLEHYLECTDCADPGRCGLSGRGVLDDFHQPAFRPQPISTRRTAGWS